MLRALCLRLDLTDTQTTIVVTITRTKMIKLTQVNIAINASSDMKGNMLECDFKFAVELVSETIVVDRSVDAT